MIRLGWVVIACFAAGALSGCLGASYAHLPPCEARSLPGPAEAATLIVKQTAYVDPPVLHLLDGRPYVLPRSAHAELGCNHQNTRIDPGSHQVDFAWQVTAGSPLVAGGKILWYASSLEFDATPGHIYELVVKRRLWVGYVCDLIDQTTGQTVATRGEWGSQCGDPETRVVYRRFQDAYSDVCTSRAHSQVEECIAPWFIVSRAEDQ